MIKRVTSIVISFHLFFLALLVFAPNRTPVKRVHHVKVRTVRPMAMEKKPSHPANQPAASSSTKAPSTKAKVSSVFSQTPKTSTKPQAPKKAPPSKKPAVIEKGKVVKKQTPPPIKAEVWNEIDQALAKIEKKSYPKKKSSVESPKSLTFLDELIRSSDEKDESAESLLVSFLHDTLHLPEIGEVKIQLTVRKDGTVSKVVIVSAESRKNKLYLQEHLPRLQFPTQFDQEKTWTLTFYNEI